LLKGGNLTGHGLTQTYGKTAPDTRNF